MVVVISLYLDILIYCFPSTRVLLASSIDGRTPLTTLFCKGDRSFLLGLKITIGYFSVIFSVNLGMKIQNTISLLVWHIMNMLGIVALMDLEKSKFF